MDEGTVLNSRSFQAGLSLLALSGLFWTVVQVKEQTVQLLPKTPPGIFRLCLALGYMAGIVGFVLIALALLTHMGVMRRLKEFLNNVADSLISPDLDCGPSRRSELPQLHDLGETDFRRVSSLALMEGLFDKNAQTFWSVRSTQGNRGNPRVVAYFILYPLTQRACELVEQGRLTGLNLGAADITKTFRGARAIYVGAIYATSWRSKAVALERLKTELGRYGERLPLYARPVSTDGRRVMKKYGFAELCEAADGIEVWKRDPQPGR